MRMMLSKVHWFVVLALVTISSSCTPSLRELDMVAEGTLELQMFDPPITIDFSECWQGPYFSSLGTPRNVLDIDCGIFKVNLELPPDPPEPGEISSIPWQIAWSDDETKTGDVKEDICRRPGELFPSAIDPHNITVSLHDGNAPYEYHVVTYPGNEFCAIYNLKIKVLSEPYGELQELPRDERYKRDK